MSEYKQAKEKMNNLEETKKVGWVPLSEAHKQRKSMKIGIWGPEGIGKTHFALTMPEPIYIVDTEFGVPQLFPKFTESSITYLDVCVMDEDDKIMTIASLEYAEEAVKDLAKLEEGTIIIDSGTDIWSWIGDWNEKKHDNLKKSGKFYQFHWGPANRRYRVMIWSLLSKKKVNIVITAHPKDVYDSQGKQIAGLSKAAWMKRTGHWFDFVIEMKQSIVDRRPAFVGKIIKCRYENRKMAGKEIQDITYPKLYEAYKEVMGFE